jgi:5'-nucleotidase
MRLLLSNDDGIQARGLHALMEALAPHHEVYVVAPDRERSAMGHALTLHHPLRVETVSVPYPVKQAIATSGTPSDCVKLALSVLIEAEIDMVISGINHGPNLGSDVFYSGTVSAAMEGSFYGKPSIAISLLNGNDKTADFTQPAQFIAQNLQRFATWPMPKRTTLNINFPAVALADIAGIKVTRLGKGMYDDGFEKRLDPRGVVYYWLAGEMINGSGSDYEDVEAIRNNWVPITPLQSDLTHYESMASLKLNFETPLP